MPSLAEASWTLLSTPVLPVLWCYTFVLWKTPPYTREKESEKDKQQLSIIKKLPLIVLTSEYLWKGLRGSLRSQTRVWELPVSGATDMWAHRYPTCDRWLARTEPYPVLGFIPSHLHKGPTWQELSHYAPNKETEAVRGHVASNWAELMLGTTGDSQYLAQLWSATLCVFSHSTHWVR